MFLWYCTEVWSWIWCCCGIYSWFCWDLVETNVANDDWKLKNLLWEINHYNRCLRTKISTIRDRFQWAHNSLVNQQEKWRIPIVIAVVKSLFLVGYKVEWRTCGMHPDANSGQRIPTFYHHSENHGINAFLVIIVCFKIPKLHIFRDSRRIFFGLRLRRVQGPN